jgi:hypothetical protein
MAGEISAIRSAVPNRLAADAVVASVLHANENYTAAVAERTGRLNVCMSAAGLTIGSGDKKKVKIANTVAFISAGVPALKTTAEVAFTASTHNITAHASVNQVRWYLLSLVAAGTATLTAGVQGASAVATIPATPAGGTPIGLIKLTNAAGVTIFDANVDELDEAHITDEYFDLVGAMNPTDVPAVPTSAYQPRAIS